MKEPRRQTTIAQSAPIWVELVGGPLDGQMAEVARTTIRFSDGQVRVSRGIWVPEADGHYSEDGFADEDLEVVRMRWKHDPASTK